MWADRCKVKSAKPTWLAEEPDASDFSEGFFDDLLEIIFTWLDDAEFARGIFRRTAAD